MPDNRFLAANASAVLGIVVMFFLVGVWISPAERSTELIAFAGSTWLGTWYVRPNDRVRQIHTVVVLADVAIGRRMTPLPWLVFWGCLVAVMTVTVGHMVCSLQSPTVFQLEPTLDE